MESRQVREDITGNVEVQTIPLRGDLDGLWEAGFTIFTADDEVLGLKKSIGTLIESTDDGSRTPKVRPIIKGHHRRALFGLVGG